uniref:B box-type domain-containing protein n=1 Tax=Glossina morsitans morsitans TaxID=37546 RepID=A0A1B0FGY6_GLOMM
MCRGIYQDPRSLNCLHTFCFQCIVNENFKEDVSIPFWSQPNSVQPREPTETKALSTTKTNSLYSSSPEITSVRSNSDLSTIASKQRHSSFSFKRKKSAERLTIKSKNRTKQIKDETQSNLDAKRLIVCDICQFPTELPLGGIRQLPQNFLILRKIEELHFKMSEKTLSSIWCSLCCEETSATYHCLNCTVNLCTLCKEAHERQRSTSGHKIQNILELRKKHKQKNNRNDNTRLPLKCIMHPEFEIKFFCVACLQVACTDCLALLHKGHKYETAAKAINHYGKVLKDSAEQTRPLCNYAEHSVEKLNETAKGINRKCDEIKTQVETFVNSYFEAIEVHRNTLLQQVHRARESKVEMILEQQLSLEKRAQDASIAIQFTQELTEMTSDVEILSFLKILLQRFEYCQQFKAPIDPKVSFRFFKRTRLCCL